MVMVVRQLTVTASPGRLPRQRGPPGARGAHQGAAGPREQRQQRRHGTCACPVVPCSVLLHLLYLLYAAVTWRQVRERIAKLPPAVSEVARLQGVASAGEAEVRPPYQWTTTPAGAGGPGGGGQRPPGRL